MKYSDIFNIYNIDNISFYNILKKIQLPNDKTIELYDKYIVPYSMPWTSLSHMLYGDVSYYWLIQLANQDKKLNPLFVEIATEIYIIKPTYLNTVITAINNKL